MGRGISSPVKFKREAPPQMSSALRSVPKTDAGGGKLALERSEKSAPSCTVSAAEQKGERKMRAGGWSAAEMLRPLLPARSAAEMQSELLPARSAAEMQSELLPARSAAEMPSLIAASAECGRNAVRIAASAKFCSNGRYHR